MEVYNLTRTRENSKRENVQRSPRYLDSLSLSRYSSIDYRGITMDIQSKDRLHGTLDALVLKTLSVGPRHGYAIGRWIEQATGDAIQVEEGSLYPALYRMERRGWIEAQWGTSEGGRKVKIYRLTANGRKQLRLEIAEWSLFANAVSRVLLPNQ